MKFERIPDICSLYLEGNLNISDIVKLKSSKEAKAFTSWLMGNKDKDKDSILEDYYHATKRQSKLDSIPVKIVRYITTGVAGLVPGVGGVVGAAAGLADSFLVDEFKSKTPNMFFDTIKRKVKKNNKKNKELEEISIPVRDKIVIDLTEERKLDNEKLAVVELKQFVKKILSTHSQDEVYIHYEKAKQIFEQTTTRDTLIIFLEFLVIVSEYDKINRLEILEFITSYILFFVEKKDDNMVYLLRKSYMSVLINSIQKETFNQTIGTTIVHAVDAQTFYEYIYNLIQDYSRNKEEYTLQLAKKMSAIYMYLTGTIEEIVDSTNIEKIVMEENKLSIEVIG